MNELIKKSFYQCTLLNLHDVTYSNFSRIKDFCSVLSQDIMLIPTGLPGSCLNGHC